MNNGKDWNQSLSIVEALSETLQCDIIETHISWVLLTEQYVYKIKKPVNFGFLDFSTLAKRREYCNEEIRLNRRLAQALYLNVVPICGSYDLPDLNGSGEPLEYAVKMCRFAPGRLLKEQAEQRGLTEDKIDQLTEIIADFHQSVERADEDSPYGGCDNIKHWFDENFSHIAPLLSGEAQKQQLHRLRQWGDNEWHRRKNLMHSRKQQGFIRECHGDLHLGNMTLVDDKVVPFDCIEFNPMLRWIDVISETAFLFNDLLYFNYEQYAYRFFNRYLQRTGDYEGLCLLRYYSVYRALVRAKVALLRMAQQTGNGSAIELARRDYADFTDIAERFSRTEPLKLIITHGFSGSGKSYIAAKLAERIGAFQLRSDIERKRLFGYDAEANTASTLANGVYSQDAGLKTYRRLEELSRYVLDAGFTVIVDATFLDAEQRDRFRRLAASCGAVFQILDCRASEQTLCRRISERKQDASEATLAVLAHQQKTATPLSEQELSTTVVVDTEHASCLDELLSEADGLAIQSNSADTADIDQ